jgi:uncharacterized membrane protein YkoI
MASSAFPALALLLTVFAAVAPPASAEEPVRVAHDERAAPQPGDKPTEKFLRAVPSGPPDGPDELQRARDAARAATPREAEDDDGLKRAREAAKAADPKQLPAVRKSAPDEPRSGACLSGRDARGAIRAKRAVTLSIAARAARDAWDGELIDYKLCDFGGALAYELTLLNPDGKVARVRVDAANGKLLGVR